MRLPLLPALAALLALGSGPPPRASAQAPDAGGAATAASRDSARLVREARSEQARFERVRRNHLPWAWGGGSGECDERIGRFCLTHGGGSDDWEPPPEADEIRAARDRLLQRLAEAQSSVPTDGWTAGQRVRYLVEGRRIAEARAAAARCAAAPWWCAALKGFVHHYSGDPGTADSAFSSALSSMPTEVRRAWTDLTPLLDPASYRAYRRLDDAGKEGFEERFWRLGDPFYMRPGNELRSEHLARNVWDLLQDRARSTENLSWGDDLREILLRYGWPSGWERVRERPGSLSPPSLVSHYTGTDMNLLPPAELMVSEVITEGEWDQDSERPRTGYGLPLPDSAGRWLDSLDHQFAVFRRGDSARVVAAYELPPDSFAGGAWIDAALAVVEGEARRPLVSPFPGSGTSGVHQVAVPQGRLLLSLEILSEEARRAARARFGVVVPVLQTGLIGVSDLLLLRSPDDLPDSLPAALHNVRGSDRVTPGERLAVYWEMYGLETERDQNVTMTLRLLEEDAGWLRRMAGRVGLGGESDAVRLRWQELAEPAPVVGRSLAIQIPEVEPGTYSLELSVTLPGREALTVTRRLQVR